MKHRPRVGAVSKQLLEEWELSEQCGQKHQATVAILNIGWRHQRMQQQTQCIDENVALLAFDQLASIEPMSIDAGPPFRAFHALAIDDAGSGTGLGFVVLAAFDVERVMDLSNVPS